MNALHAMPRARRHDARDARDARGPSRARMFANGVVFQAAWFACILGAAHGRPAWGTAAVAAAVGWHAAISARPAIELALAGVLCAVALVAESVMVALGHVAYASGQPVAALPPYWLVALWAEFAIALNVTLRWLKRRPWLAAALGAVCGPLSFVGGVRLGAARFVYEPAALVSLAAMWALLMPLVMALSDRLDGVATGDERG
jgi:hypothetical protein